MRRTIIVAAAALALVAAVVAAFVLLSPRSEPTEPSGTSAPVATPGVPATATPGSGLPNCFDVEGSGDEGTEEQECWYEEDGAPLDAKTSAEYVERFGAVAAEFANLWLNYSSSQDQEQHQRLLLAIGATESVASQASAVARADSGLSGLSAQTRLTRMGNITALSVSSGVVTIEIPAQVHAQYTLPDGQATIWELDGSTTIGVEVATGDVVWVRDSYPQLSETL